MKEGGVKFHEGGPELSQLETWFPPEVLDLFYQTFS